MLALINGWKIYILALAWLFVSGGEFAGYDIVAGITQANALENIWGALLLFAGRSTADKAIAALKR